MLGCPPRRAAHEEARAVFGKLSARLDQLTSFHFVPKPFQGTELTVRANVPALSLEEKTPTAMTSADTLAPEEARPRPDLAPTSPRPRPDLAPTSPRSRPDIAPISP